MEDSGRSVSSQDELDKSFWDCLVLITSMCRAGGSTADRHLRQPEVT